MKFSQFYVEGEKENFKFIHLTVSQVNDKSKTRGFRDLRV